MKTFYKLSIPKPCHEDWSTMTPNEKGRFCKSCTKTVVDFTKMDVNQIQDYISENKHQRICGHIKQTQLDAINIQLPETIFQQQLSFHKLFLLALLIAMGTSILSCSDKKGNIKKIETIEIVSKKVDSVETKKDVLKDPLDKKAKKPSDIPIEDYILTGKVIEIVDGLMVIEPTGEPFSYHLVDTKPRFKDTPKNLSKKDEKRYFHKSISKLVQENFNINQGNLGLSGIQRIFTHFEIDKQGKIQNIKIRGPHPVFEKEAKRVIELFPQFIPAKHNDKTASIVYNLPITFKIED